MATKKPPGIAVRSKTLDRLLSCSVDHRLHLGFVLVGRLRLDPCTVLDLRSPMVDIVTGHLITSEGVLRLMDPLVDLVYWHAARQRLDRRRTGNRWTSSSDDRVLVDADGNSFDKDAANDALSKICRAQDLPILTLEALRHPCLR